MSGLLLHIFLTQCWCNYYRTSECNGYIPLTEKVSNRSDWKVGEKMKNPWEDIKLSDYENHMSFCVVNLDQLESGLSFYRNISWKHMIIAKMVVHTYVLMQYLLKKYNQEKLYLVGHSWGSLLVFYFLYSYL